MTTSQDTYSRVIDSAATSTVIIAGETVVKMVGKVTQPELLYNNEIMWLMKLHTTYAPSLIYAKDLVIITQYHGEPVTKETAPPNFQEWMTAIIDNLHSKNCYHHDIQPNNILIKDERITLIDYGWATETPEKPNNKHLGGDFRAEDDYKMLDKVLEYLEL